MQVSNDKEMIMTVSSRIIVSTVIVLVVLTVQSAAAQQAPVPPRGNQPTNANEPRATNGHGLYQQDGVVRDVPAIHRGSSYSYRRSPVQTWRPISAIKSKPTRPKSRRLL